MDTKDPEEADDPEGHSPSVSESSASTKVATEDQCQMIDCQEMVEEEQMRELEAAPYEPIELWQVGRCTKRWSNSLFMAYLF